jgi:hypothetical protein
VATSPADRAPRGFPPPPPTRVPGAGSVPPVRRGARPRPPAAPVKQGACSRGDLYKQQACAPPLRVSAAAQRSTRITPELAQTGSPKADTDSRRSAARCHPPSSPPLLTTPPRGGALQANATGHGCADRHNARRAVRQVRRWSTGPQGTFYYHFLNSTC